MECKDCIFTETHMCLSCYQKKYKGWVPVSKALPREGELVLCTIDDGICKGTYIFELRDGEWRDYDGCSVECGEITAWMPLPEPYESEV